MLLKQLTNPFVNIRFDASDDSGSGGDDDKKKKPVEPTPLSDEVLESLNKLIERSGGTEETAKILYDDNKQLRDKIRNLEEKTLGEGKVAVEKKDAELIQKIRDEFGDFDTVKEKLETIEEKEAKIAEYETKQRNSEIAQEYGYNAEVLNDLLKGSEIETEKKKDGEEEKLVAHIKDGDSKVELSKYIEEKKAMYLPALQVDSESTGGKRITRQQPKPQNGKGSGNKVFDEFMDKTKKEAEAGNPLLPSKKEQ